MFPLSQLTADDLTLLRQLVAGEALLSFYLALAEAESARGEDASLALIGRARRGAALGARFDGLTVITTTGALGDDDLRALLEWPGRLELHLTEAHHAQISTLTAHRLGATRRMVAMQAPAAGPSPDLDVTLLDREGFAEAAAMMATYNPETVLSARMASLPFAAIRKGGRIIAMAGTIGVVGETALLGHFLTVPEARGRGLARRLALHLRWHFAQLGIAQLVLATTEDNAQACRAYAAAGFTVLDRRVQVERPE